MMSSPSPSPTLLLLLQWRDPIGRPSQEENGQITLGPVTRAKQMLFVSGANQRSIMGTKKMANRIWTRRQTVACELMCS